jgi:hypothetical protein
VLSKGHDKSGQRRQLKKMDRGPVRMAVSGSKVLLFIFTQLCLRARPCAFFFNCRSALLAWPLVSTHKQKCTAHRFFLMACRRMPRAGRIMCRRASEVNLWEGTDLYRRFSPRIQTYSVYRYVIGYCPDSWLSLPSSALPLLLFLPLKMLFCFL